MFTFLALYWDIPFQIIKTSIMEPDNRKQSESGEKEWENPIEPAKSSDERDKEQLLRQYKEAKRRKDNLTTEDTQPKKDI